MAASTVQGSVNPSLGQLCKDSLELIDDLEKGQERVNPSYGEHAKAIILLWGTKCGFGLGGRMGRGFLLHKLPSEGPHKPIRWSAPVFLKVRVGQAGLCFGYARSKTYMMAMSDRVLKELESGGHVMYGVDQTFTILQATDESKSDVIALSGGTTDLVAASIVSGFMLDFSFAAGSMTVDRDRMVEHYGQGVSTHDVLVGRVRSSPELDHLYERLSGMIMGAHTDPLSLTKTSLERMTAGYDPDRRLVSSHSATLVHSGDSDVALDRPVVPK